MWKERYKIGIPKIDQQHKELFKRSNKLITIVRNDTSLENKVNEIEKLLIFMEEYVNIHFSDEEQLQKQINYPKYKAHKKTHSNFKNYIKNVIQRFKNDNRDKTLIMEFSGRLMTWLINHVANEDQKISNFLAENNKEE